MTERPALSNGELEVARLLWQLGAATVRQVHESLPDDRAMDFATVQTYLRRMETKGYASSKLEGRARVYSPTARPRTVIRQTINDLVERLFGGETMPLVRHLIEERGIRDDELAELRRLVERLEKEGHGDDK